MPRLSDMTVNTVPIPTRVGPTLWDDGSPLGVRITSNGAKTFIVMIGSGRRHTIGRYGDITLAEARAAAQRIRAEQTLGRAFPESVTLASARELYLSHINVRPNTRERSRSSLGKLKAGNLVDITKATLTHPRSAALPQSYPGARLVLPFLQMVHQAQSPHSIAMRAADREGITVPISRTH